MNKKFVVVCGPGRSGTSLAMRLVEACGYNLGKCNPPDIPDKWEGLRGGYCEHPLSNTGPPNIDQAIQKLDAEGCNALKLVHLHQPWVERLQFYGYQVYLVITRRNIDEIYSSGNSMLKETKERESHKMDSHKAYHNIVNECLEVIAKTNAYIHDGSYNVYILEFEKIIQKDDKILSGLCDFLDGGNVENLKSIIRPDIVQHYRKVPHEFN